MQAQSKRPSTRLQDTELQPIRRHRAGAQPDRHAPKYADPQMH